MRLALFAAVYLVGIKVDVICQAHDYGQATDKASAIAVLERQYI